MYYRYLPLLCLFGLSFALPLAVHAQEAVLSGRVIGDDGEPLPGAQVVVESMTLGTATNAEGYYEFTIPSRLVRGQEEVLLARFLGYRSSEQAITLVPGRQTVNFTLEESTLSLDDVVVTGVVDPVSGKKVPFSVGKITRENLATVPTTNSALGALQGKVAGASIVRPSGQPGTGVSILLRTPTTVQKSNSPLFVVDGVILGSTFGGTTLDLESLDIESVEVIRGAAAASLYGSRAASGVVSITTARGNTLAQGQTQVTFRSEVGLSSAPTNIDVTRHHHYAVDAEGFFVDASGVRIENQRDESQRVVAPDRIMDNAYNTPLFDNVAAFFKPGQFNTNSLTLSHRAQNTNFLVSFNNYNESGSLVNNDGFTRNNFRVNLDHQMGDQLSLSLSAFHSRSHRDDLSGSPFFDLLLYQPEVDLGLKDDQGQYLQQPDPLVPEENPLWRQASRDNFTKRTRTLASAQTRWFPLTWLNFTGTISYDRSDINDQVYVPKGTVISLDNDSRSTGAFERDNEFTDSFNGSLGANLNQRFGQLNARLTGQGLFEREANTFVGAGGSDLFVSGVPDLDVAATRDVASSSQEIRSNSWLTDLSLDYAGRYIGSFLFRRDGSSLFGPENRWNSYYRAAVAYRVAEESFWPLKGVVTEFKPRFALGTAGGRPNFADQYETWSVSSSGAVTKSTLGNRFLKPSFTTEYEYGLDMIFYDRYSVQLTYAQQVTEDQIIQLPQRAVTGYSSQWANTGVQEGNTFEVTLEAQLVSAGDFRWSTTLVGDRSRSEIVEWNRPGFTSDLRLIDEGGALGDMWGERFLTNVDELARNGIAPEFWDQFQVNDDGYVVAVGAGNSWQDGVAKDLWGTSVDIDGTNYKWGHPIIQLDENGFAELVQMGSSIPDFSMGWLNNVRWKGFSLHTHLHAQFGGEVYNGTRQRMYQYLRHGDIDQADKPDASKKEFEYYRAGLYNSNNYTSAFVEGGTYVKLRELALSYSLTQRQLVRLGLGRWGPERVRIGVIGRNLVTLTSYSGFDPEVDSVLRRLDSFSYPNTRTFTAHFEITF